MRFKKVFSVFMTAVISFTMLVSMFAVEVSADSNSRISTYINLAKSREETDVDLTGLTESQLRFLGVWLSNYFSPFMMEITGSSEVTDGIKEEMAKALTTNLAFSDALARQLVEIVYGYMKATAQPIYPAYRETNGDWVVFNQDENKVEGNVKVSYATFLACMSGSVNEVSGGLNAYNDIEITRDIKTIKIEKLYDIKKSKLGNEKIPVGYYLTVDGKIPDYGDAEYYLLAVPGEDSLLRLENASDPDGVGFFDECRTEEEYDERVELINDYLNHINNWTFVGAESDRDDFKGTADQFKGWLNTVIAGNSGSDLGSKSYYDLASPIGVCLWIWGQYTDKFYNSWSSIAIESEFSFKNISLSMKEEKGYFAVILSDTVGWRYSSKEFSAYDIDASVNIESLVFPGNRGYFVWLDDNGDIHPVADFNTNGAVSNFTASQTAFAECLKVGNVNLGYGFSVTDLFITDTEGGVTGLQYLQELIDEKGLTSEQVAAMTIYGTTMCVDCFGNIIQAGGIHQRVMIPACMNPYAWQRVDSSGEDAGDAGQYMMYANFIHMANAGGVNDTKNYSISDFNLNQDKDFDNDPLAPLRECVGTTKRDVTYQDDPFFENFVVAGSKDPVVSVLRKEKDWCFGKWNTDMYCLPLPHGTVCTDKLNNVVNIDNLGAYDTGKDFNAFTVISMGDNMIIKNGNLFSNALQDVDKPMISWGNETNAAACVLYVSYCWASLYESSSKSDTIGKLGYRLATENVPGMSNKGIPIEGYDERLDTITNWIYYLLHPTAGFRYVTTWLTNKINHLLLGIHSAMVGTNGVGVTTGTTKYRSHMGYVTTPDLSEIQWTDTLINFYNKCIPFIIILLLIIMVFSYLTGVLSLQRAVIGLVLFSVFTVMPVNLINGMVGESNRISQKIYGDKFTYWALVQNETYAKAIDRAVAEGMALDSSTGGTQGYENYLRTLYSANSQVYSNQGGESILLKWQAPKKMASMVLSAQDAKSVSGLGQQGMQMLRGMLNKTYSGQSYTDDEDAVYMYRSYIDITNFSRYVWKYFKNNKVLKDKVNYGNVFENNFTKNAINKYSDPSKYTMDDYFPMNIDVFNFGLVNFNQSNTLAVSQYNKYWDVDKYFAPTGGFDNDKDRVNKLKAYISKNTTTGKSYEELSRLAAHALYSENVYYYFSWYLYAMGMNPESSIAGGMNFKSLLLDNNGSFFYDNDSGDLVDVMDMKTLFTNVIPYMKKGNDIVRAFDDIYGIFIYEDVPTEEGHWNDSSVSSDPEWRSKYWHNLNVSRLYGIYCPWVDVMYDCSYSKPETITVMGSKFTVLDPLDPASYKGSGRDMIFSEKEMHDYGLGEGDLTAAERLILKANKGFSERMFDLLNYYNFSDVSLNSAAAINCAFEFNNVFSESGIFSENHNIYPQSFDLENFSYDAYLRLILANSTGEDLLSASSSSGDGTAAGETSGDFYETVVNNSSTVTVLVMLILDVISVYLIPTVKVFFLVAMFLMSFIIILVSVFKIEDNMKFIQKVLKQFLLPLLGYFAVTVLFSWVLSLFMGTGNNAVTQSKKLSISMGDPTVVMIIMIVLDVLLLMVYFKILKVVAKDMKHGLKLMGGFLGSLGGATLGLAGLAAAGVAGGAIHAASSAGQGVSNGARRLRHHHERSQDRNYQSEEVEAIRENTEAVRNSQKGTGIENHRANERGSNNASSNETARDMPVNENINNQKEEERRLKEINKKAGEGSVVTPTHEGAWGSHGVDRSNIHSSSQSPTGGMRRDASDRSDIHSSSQRPTGGINHRNAPEDRGHHDGKDIPRGGLRSKETNLHQDLDWVRQTMGKKETQGKGSVKDILDTSKKESQEGVSKNLPKGDKK